MKKSPHFLQELVLIKRLFLQMLKECQEEEMANLFLSLCHAFEKNSFKKSHKILQEIIASQQLLGIIKVFSLYNILINIVEERHKINSTSYSFKENQKPLSQKAKNALKHLAFYPVFTAHPTQSMRRTFLEAYQEISTYVACLSNNPTQTIQEKSEQEIKYRLHLLYKSHLARQEKLEVLSELDNLLYLVETSILPSALKTLNSIQKALNEPLKQSPIILGSWIGGDRDGNPFVTNALMTQTLRIQHAFIIELYIKEVRALTRELSLSSDFCTISDTFKQSIEQEKMHLDPSDAILHQHEPFRAKLLLMEKKLKNRLLSVNSPLEIPYTYHNIEEFIHDIDLMLNHLEPYLRPHLERLRHLALLAGFHALRLDFREHKEVFLNALSETFSFLGLADSDFLSKNETKKLEIINNAFLYLEKNPLDLHSLIEHISLKSANILEAFSKIAWAKQNISKESVRSVIISMSESASDILGVLWLVQLAKLENEISLTPLFETIDDLENAPKIMQTLSQNPHYNNYLNHQNRNQQIMIGYSDSSKDGGIFASNYYLNNAITKLIELEKSLNLSFLLFHGRGGSVSRGGLSLESALDCAPYKSAKNILKLTEQGEVISLKYLNLENAEYNLHNALNALLKKNLQEKAQKTSKEHEEILQTIARLSYQAYRKLVYETKGFLEYFKLATPIYFIQELPLGSRPSKRKDSTKIEDLRAIPWVFAWTQNRCILPAWYGLGSALKTLEPTILQTLYKENKLFKVVLDNVAQVLLKVDLEIFESYHSLAKDLFNAKEIFNAICDEFKITKELILCARKESELLESEPTTYYSILFRRPYLNALNALQIELIKAFYATKDKDKQAHLLHQVHSSIVGIAQGMRNTG
ncbi:phosphoenolpyruvate carboxylase [Helicobacter cetorum]|uniref:Phosphoenolpyruvate carboxylase n=1 Tax=Helicobacter cetorum (strain ATCC BAA-429 / MIT 00-7128) TaxID=182217 RepID=I0EMK4_HELC0|nr:phosphoenolpyruvate carboxylase [Helicobacter cetorum]AFI04173.1 phosphoenolpyruvate carboxylase [Helicobacter cetorum MIT 00-7128]